MRAPRSALGRIKLDDFRTVNEHGVLNNMPRHSGVRVAGCADGDRRWRDDWRLRRRKWVNHVGGWRGCDRDSHLQPGTTSQAAFDEE